ncbi:AcrR family transcriptional regulator [Arthrobacter sp. ERGS1:01]|uniref:TetR/AcrR family transcriptional regulator n=1 Tax=Arthrobacter sp. ERGS1:01 TaxID=1704044 RepID=UPI0006B66BED|nr:TetR/AcrR family transcriptional regulator [Arthrobacter sp. ERGS1:01]ALE05253.1 AcrR family transcriptional regulator [Arthrobacter sp. ERGS1:01]
MTQPRLSDQPGPSQDRAADPATCEPVKLGRKRDHTRDPEILEAALAVLAETGYDGMTIDMVAARAKAGKATLYRRWPSKAELVLDAVACLKMGDTDPAHLPDTGTLRGDLVAMIKPHSIEANERKLQIMAGLMSMLSRSPELMEAATATIVEPRVAVNRVFMGRAVARGEIADTLDVEMLSLVTPAMAAFRVLVLKKPVDREFLISMIDGVLLPAVDLGSGERQAD